VEPRKEPTFSYRVSRAIYPAFRVLFPNQVIRADDLARTTVDIAVRGTGKPGGLIITKGCALEIPGRRNRKAERIAG